MIHCKHTKASYLTKPSLPGSIILSKFRIHPHSIMCALRGCGLDFGNFAYVRCANEGEGGFENMPVLRTYHMDEPLL